MATYQYWWKVFKAFQKAYPRATKKLANLYGYSENSPIRILIMGDWARWDRYKRVVKDIDKVLRLPGGSWSDARLKDYTDVKYCGQKRLEF